MVSVKVRAGSSGKPNMQKEREQWGQLMPVISDAMKQVAELRATGNYDAAEAVLELMRETLRRYDEYLDLDALVPPTEKGADGKPVAQAQAAEQLMATQQQLQAVQEELVACQQELEKARAGEQAKVAAENAKTEKAVMDAAQADKDRELKEKIAREEIASKERISKQRAEHTAADLQNDIARDEVRFTRELEHKERLKRIEVRATEDDVAHREALATAQAEREARQVEIQQTVVALLDRMIATSSSLESAIADMAKAAERANGARVSEIELGADGLPKKLVSRPLAQH